MSDPYVIQVDLDRSKAAAAATAAVADLKRIEAEAKAAATAEEQGVYQILAAEKGAAAQRRTILQQTNQQRISAAAEAAKAELGYQQQVKATGDEHEDAGQKAGRSLALTSAAISGVQMGLGKLAQLARAYGDAMEQSYEKSREYAAKFLTDMGRFNELAYLRGQQPGAKVSMQEAAFAAATGTTPEEALAFRTQFQYRGASAIGKTITAAQAEVLQRQSALLAVAKGQDVGAAGELAGLLAQQKDVRGQDEGAAARAVLIQQMRGTAILSRGAGSPTQLLPQWRELMSTGLTRSSEEAAMMISLMAEYDPGSAAVYARRALEGLHETTGDAGKALKAAGVTQAMTPLEATAKLRATIDATKAKLGPGTDTLTALKSLGFEERQAIGIQQLADKGERVFRDRQAVGAQITQQSVAQDINQALANETVIDRKQTAEQRMAELQRGQAVAPAERLRRQAIAELTKEGGLDSSDALIQQYVTGQISFGMLGSKARVIDARAAEILKRRIPEAIKADPRKMAELQANSLYPLSALQESWDPLSGTLQGTIRSLTSSPEERSNALGYGMGMIQKAGGDPLKEVVHELRQIKGNQQHVIRQPMAPPKPNAVPGRAVGRGN